MVTDGSIYATEELWPVFEVNIQTFLLKDSKHKIHMIMLAKAFVCLLLSEEIYSNRLSCACVYNHSYSGKKFFVGL